MASKIIKIKVSNASKLQIQTLMLEIGLIIKQWFRKVKVKIEVVKQMDTKLEIIIIISVVIYFAVIWQDLMMLQT